MTSTSHARFVKASVLGLLLSLSVLGCAEPFGQTADAEVYMRSSTIFTPAEQQAAVDALKTDFRTRFRGQKLFSVYGDDSMTRIWYGYGNDGMVLKIRAGEPSGSGYQYDCWLVRDDPASQWTVQKCSWAEG